MLKRLKLAMAMTTAVVGAALVMPGLANAAAAAAGRAPAASARYSVKTIGDVVQLRDNTTDSTVSVLTGTSNAYEFVVHGKNVISMNIPSVEQLRNNPGLNGIPFLGPYANRIDSMFFYANGKKYNFDPDVGNVRGPVPQQGFLSSTHDWKVVEAKADANGAYVVNKLDFYKNPDWMAQFPFAQTYTMTIRLKDGTLEVNTKIDNLSTQPLPVSIGFHPYFAVPETDRNHWRLDFGAATHWIETPDHLPTGEVEPADKFLGGDRHNVDLSKFTGTRFDDVFADLDRDAQGRGSVIIKGDTTSIKVSAGPKIKTFLLYSEILNPAGAAAGGGRGGAAGGAGGGGRGGAAPGGAPAAGGAPGAAGAPAAAGAAAAGRGGAPGGAAPAAGRGGGNAAPAYTGPIIPLTAPGDVPRNTRGFIAIEPMAAITNAFNLAQKGVYKELQYVAPGSSWDESIWITPSGY